MFKLKNAKAKVVLTSFILSFLYSINLRSQFVAFSMWQMNPDSICSGGGSLSSTCFINSSHTLGVGYVVTGTVSGTITGNITTASVTNFNLTGTINASSLGSIGGRNINQSGSGTAPGIGHANAGGGGAHGGGTSGATAGSAGTTYLDPP